jgi:hypothetical protein
LQEDTWRGTATAIDGRSFNLNFWLFGPFHSCWFLPQCAGVVPLLENLPPSSFLASGDPFHVVVVPAVVLLQFNAATTFLIMFASLPLLAMICWHVSRRSSEKGKRGGKRKRKKKASDFEFQNLQLKH